MNRICKQFDDIKNFNRKKADVQPFNYAMLMSGRVKQYNPKIGELFCDLDSMNLTNLIEASVIDYSRDKTAKAGYQLLAEMIISEITERFGSLEETYPHVVKYLFSGENASKSTGKQMFWRVYGSIALRNLKDNLKNCMICENCGAKVPLWDTEHTCQAQVPGFLTCGICGKVVPRMNSSQKRCMECQKNFSHESELIRKKETYLRRKELRNEIRRKRIDVLVPGAGT